LGAWDSLAMAITSVALTRSLQNPSHWMWSFVLTLIGGVWIVDLCPWTGCPDWYCLLPSWLWIWESLICFTRFFYLICYPFSSFW
jgi:hypothetical protein